MVEVGKFALWETYLRMIENAPGSEMFRSSFFQTSITRGAGSMEGVHDLCQSGRLSCAFFVSAILKIFDLTKSLHVTVSGLENDLLESGWWLISNDDRKPGAVVVWEPQVSMDGEVHSHVGFLANGYAVSNHPKGDKIIRHDQTFGDTRAIARVYFHEKLIEITD